MWAYHRTVSLMCHILNMFLKIVHKRIFRKLHLDIDETHLALEALKWLEALFVFNVRTRRCLDVNQTLNVCLIEYMRHFRELDIIVWSNYSTIKTWIRKILGSSVTYILTKKQWSKKGTRLLRKQIRRGVRQDCVCPPMKKNRLSL